MTEVKKWGGTPGKYDSMEKSMRLYFDDGTMDIQAGQPNKTEDRC